MAFIFTPRQLSLRSELYHQLGALTTAGLPLRKALETLHENPISRSFRAPLRRIDASLEKGQTFAESITLAGGWLAEFDIALLRAGEESGRLDACFKLLSDYYQNRAQLARTILGEMAYPLLVLHAPVFIMPFATALLSGDWSSYGRNVLATLLPLYAVVFLIIFACQGRRGARCSANASTHSRASRVPSARRRATVVQWATSSRSPSSAKPSAARSTPSTDAVRCARPSAAR